LILDVENDALIALLPGTDCTSASSAGSSQKIKGQAKGTNPASLIFRSEVGAVDSK
jgi:hypothetical protein